MQMGASGQAVMLVCTLHTLQISHTSVTPLHQQEHRLLPHIARLFTGAAERKFDKFDNLTSTSCTRWKVGQFLKHSLLTSYHHHPLWKMTLRPKVTQPSPSLRALN
jgi:hypothetical protein